MLKKKENLKKWKEDVKEEGTRRDKCQAIDAETFEKFKEARKHYEQVTTRTLQQWAMAVSFPYSSENFSFIASLSWAKKFKKRHGIKQRKITKFISRNDIASMEEIIQAAERFRGQAAMMMQNYDPKYIVNTDQTGCTYESFYNRSLDFKGSKTVLVKKQNLAKITHSYTAQYSLTLSGELLPHVFICTQEPNNIFGPKVSREVERLTLEFGNVIVTCSKSGKLTKTLYRRFLETVMLPYVGENDFLLVIDSWSGQVDATMYDEIFTNNTGKPTCTIKVIPPKCTPLCQPCDVYFYRQVKNIIKKIQSAPQLLQEHREISKREDAIKIHSIVHFMLSAPMYSEMIRYAWFGSKLLDEKPIFRNANEICFPPTLVKTKCNCERVSFIQCSWCQNNLCFKCLYDDYHPKKCERSANK